MSHLYYGDGNWRETRELPLILKEKLDRPELIQQGSFEVSEAVLRGAEISGKGYYVNWIRCHIDGFPSQCGVCILYGWELISVTEEFFKDYWNWIEEILKALKYTKVMVTLNKSQATIQNGLIANGFKVVDEFTNKRSANKNYILTKDIP